MHICNVSTVSDIIIIIIIPAAAAAAAATAVDISSSLLIKHYPVLRSILAPHIFAPRLSTFPLFSSYILLVQAFSGSQKIDHQQNIHINPILPETRVPGIIFLALTVWVYLLLVFYAIVFEIHSKNLNVPARKQNFIIKWSFTVTQGHIFWSQ